MLSMCSNQDIDNNFVVEDMLNPMFHKKVVKKYIESFELEKALKIIESKY